MLTSGSSALSGTRTAALHPNPVGSKIINSKIWQRICCIVLIALAFLDNMRHEGSHKRHKIQLKFVTIIPLTICLSSLLKRRREDKIDSLIELNSPPGENSDSDLESDSIELDLIRS